MRGVVMVGWVGWIASRENGETKKLLEELPIAIFMRHQREKIKINIEYKEVEEYEKKKFNYMNLHFFHEKMKLKKIFFCIITACTVVYSSQFHICLRSFSLQLKSKISFLYRIHTFKYMYGNRQLWHHLKISKCLLYTLVMKIVMKIEQIRFYYGNEEGSLSRIKFAIHSIDCIVPSADAQQSS